jgi:hypothetical protein
MFINFMIFIEFCPSRNIQQMKMLTLLMTHEPLWFQTYSHIDFRKVTANHLILMYSKHCSEVFSFDFLCYLFHVQLNLAHLS